MVWKHLWLSPDDGGAAGGDAGSSDVTISADAINVGSTEASPSVDSKAEKAADDQGKAPDIDALNAEIAKLKAESAKQKAALDKATHEASEAKKSLKAKMTQEEIDAQAKQEAAEKAAQELDELRKQVAKGNTVKTVMGKLGLDEESAGSLADCLYGAADIDNAMLQIQKAWQSREAALRKEYGKITGPGAGTDSNSPEAQAIKRASEFGKAKSAQNEQAQKALSAYIR